VEHSGGFHWGNGAFYYVKTLFTKGIFSSEENRARSNKIKENSTFASAKSQENWVNPIYQGFAQSKLSRSGRSETFLLFLCLPLPREEEEEALRAEDYSEFSLNFSRLREK
jgi:hypothetical protein